MASRTRPRLARRSALWDLAAVLLVVVSGVLVVALALEQPDDGTLSGVAIAQALFLILVLVRRHDTGDPRATREAFQRLLVLALPVSVVVTGTFTLAPGLARRFFRPPPVGRSGFEFGADMRPGDLSGIALSYDVAFRARFPSGLIPAHERLYWRGSVYTKSEGLTWKVGRGSRGESSDGDPLPLPEATVPAGAVRQEIVVEPRPLRLVFGLDSPLAARGLLPAREGKPENESGAPNPPAGRPARRDPAQLVRLPGGVLLPPPSHPSRRLVAWVDSTDPAEATPRTLKPAERAALLALPFPLPHELYEPVAQFVAAKKRSFDALEMEIARYFKLNGFSYTLSPGVLPEGTPEARFVWFLTQTRSGYCEHYAAALASLFRYAGVPARVVTGFQGGVRNDSMSTVTVRDSESHAWVEAFDETAGVWKRFDATAWIAPEGLAQSRAFIFSGFGSGAFSFPRALFGSLADISEPLRTFWAFSVSGALGDASIEFVWTALSGLAQEPEFVFGACVLALTIGGITLWLQRRREGNTEAVNERLTRRFRRAARVLCEDAAPWRGVLDLAEQAAGAAPSCAGPLRSAGSDLARLLYAEVSEPEARELRSRVRRALRDLRRLQRARRPEAVTADAARNQ